ncbi:tripartite tricarboxylate transporter substrate binding protein [Humitalea sp. 24SJ18S-53]|uniref:tripartite tricarboxylate transporter substrate binding protein n=1 Tax=Humitalea sp. 24SJ18S-53 TaxID=3422307 RepID=UPI003D6774AF
MIHRKTLLAALAAGLMAPRAEAQAPARLDGPLTLLVPFAPGGPTDIAARFLAPELSSRLGVPVVVENRSGAGGAIGMRYVQTIAPGLANRMVMVSSTSTQVMVPLTDMANVGFDPVEDMQQIALIGTYFTVIATSVGSGITSMAELRAAAAQRLEFGSPGTNTEAHLFLALLARTMGARDWEHVPYRGTGPALTALMANEIKLALASPLTILPLIQDGRARALAVTAAERSPMFPDTPTLRESGVDLVLNGFFGLTGPKAMDTRIADAIASATVDALASPALRQQLDRVGLQPPASQSRESFRAFQRAEYQRFSPLVASP